MNAAKVLEDLKRRFPNEPEYFFFDHKVEAITRENELYYLHTAHGDFCTRWVVIIKR